MILVRNSSAYLQFFIFSLAFLSLVYYIGLLQVRSFDSIYNIVIVFITMTLIAPFRSVLQKRECTIQNLSQTKELTRVLFLGLLLISFIYLLLFMFNDIITTTFFTQNFPEAMRWLNNSTNLGKHTFFLKFLILFTPLYLLYLFISYLSSNMLRSYKYALIPALYIALIIFIPIFSLFSFQMSELRTFTLLQWLISPLLIVLDLILLFLVMLLTSVVLYFINPFFMKPLIKVLLKAKIVSKIKLETVGLLLIAYIAPFLLIWALINTLHIDIYFFHALEYISVSVSTIYISLSIMLIFLLISLPSVYFLFNVLLSYFFKHKYLLTILTVISTFSFYTSLGYHKYNSQSYENIHQDIQASQSHIRDYFCALKRENIEEAIGTEKSTDLQGYRGCQSFTEDSKIEYQGFDF